MIAGDAVLESNVVSSSLRDRSYNEHDIGSVKADDLQEAGRTAPDQPRRLQFQKLHRLNLTFRVNGSGQPQPFNRTAST
jgi:hypothetical protein